MHLFQRILFLSIFLGTTHFSIGQSTDFDKKLGMENAQMVKEQMGVYENEAMTQYVSEIGARLVSNLENPLFKYEFKLVPDPAPNAFALPGGYVFVTTGLISILRNEDEMACILAHEIVHANNRHSVKQIRKGILPGILSIPGAILGIVSTGLGDIFKAPSNLLVAKYSRKFETEADVEGIKLANKAGYDPNALKYALSRMTTTIELYTGQAEEKSYFNDHPFTADRVSKIEEEISKMSLTPSDAIADYLIKFDGVLFGNDPKNGVIQRKNILNPTLNLYIDFPDDWKITIEKDRMAGVNESEEAAIVFAEELKHKHPKHAADVFMKSIPEKHKANMRRMEYKKVDGSGLGELISIREDTKEGMVYAHVLWLPHDGKLLKIGAVSTRDQMPILKKIVDDLRVLSEKERKSIMLRSMYSVKANGKEDLNELSERSSNTLKMDLLESINDSKSGEKLEKGLRVKVIKASVYK